MKIEEIFSFVHSLDTSQFCRNRNFLCYFQVIMQNFNYCVMFQIQFESKLQQWLCKLFLRNWIRRFSSQLDMIVDWVPPFNNGLNWFILFFRMNQTWRKRLRSEFLTFILNQNWMRKMKIQSICIINYFKVKYVIIRKFCLLSAIIWTISTIRFQHFSKVLLLKGIVNQWEINVCEEKSLVLFWTIRVHRSDLFINYAHCANFRMVHKLLIYFEL